MDYNWQYTLNDVSIDGVLSSRTLTTHVADETDENNIVQVDNLFGLSIDFATGAPMSFVQFKENVGAENSVYLKLSENISSIPSDADAIKTFSAPNNNDLLYYDTAVLRSQSGDYVLLKNNKTKSLTLFFKNNNGSSPVEEYNIPISDTYSGFVDTLSGFGNISISVDYIPQWSQIMVTILMCCILLNIRMIIMQFLFKIKMSILLNKIFRLDNCITLKIRS